MASKFALGISIGAALAPAFSSTIASSEAKIKGLESKLQGLGAQKVAVTELQKYKNELASLEARAKIAGANTGSLRKEIIAAKDNFKAATVRAKGLGVATGELESEEKRLDAALRSTNRSLKARNTLAVQTDFRAGAMAGMLDAAAPALAMAVPIKAAIDFESTMADIKKVVDFGSPAEFKAMEQSILALSNRIPMAASGLGDIMAAAGQAGIAKKDLLEFTEQAAKMGVAFDLTGAQSGEIMAKWREKMSLTLDETYALADSVNHLSNKVAIKAGELAEIVARSGSVGINAGLSSIESSALAAAFGVVGANAESAATSYQSFLGQLTRGAEATDAQKEAFEQLGLNAEDVAANMQTDAVGTIKEVLAAVKSYDVGAGNAGIIGKLFGTDASNVSAISSLAKNTALLNKVLAETAHPSQYSGSMLKEFEARSATTANSLQLLSNAVKTASINFGSALLPAVNYAIKPITTVAHWVGRLTTLCPTLTTAVGTMALGFVALPPIMFAVRMGASYLTTAKAGLTLVYGGVGKVLGFARGRLVAYGITARAHTVATKAMAAGQWAFNAAMSANPIGLVVVGIAALVAAGVVLYKNWDTVVVHLKAGWEGLKTVFSWSPVGLIMQGFSQAKNFLTAIDWSASGSAILETLANGIMSAASKPVEAMKSVLSKVREYMPFSDAKRGPLSSLTASGAAIPGTMAKGVASDTSLEGAIVNKLQLPSMAGGRGAGGYGNTIHINFNPTIHGGGDTANVTEALQLSEARLKRMILDIFHKERRLSFA